MAHIVQFAGVFLMVVGAPLSIIGFALHEQRVALRSGGSTSA